MIHQFLIINLVGLLKNKKWRLFSISASLKKPLSLSCFSISLLILFFLYSSLKAETRLIEGKWDLIYEVTGNEDLLNKFPEFENNSNSQKIIKREKNKLTVLNKTNLNPIASKVQFPVEDRYKSKFSEELSNYLKLSDDEINYLVNTSKNITKNAKTQVEAVEKIITYIRQKVEYQLPSANNPVSVLKSGKAYCEGYSNAGIMLLRVIGIPARNISCYIPPGHFWGFGGGSGDGGFHAFLEVYYDDIGWVSYDPQNSIHYADPFHIINFPQFGLSVKEISISDERKIIDYLDEPYYENFFARRSSDIQSNPILTGRIIEPSGKLITDSYRTKRWVFRDERTSNQGKGIQILENGEWALSKLKLNQKEIIYYFGDGYYMQDTVLATKIEKIQKDYDFSNPDKLIKLRLPSGRNTLKINFNDGIFDLNSRNGEILLHLSNGDYLFNLSDELIPYLLKVNEDTIGKTFDLVSLPRSPSPKYFTLLGTIKNEENTALRGEVLLINSNSKFFKSSIDATGFFGIVSNDKSYNRILYKSQGFMGISYADFSKNKYTTKDFLFAKKNSIELVFPKDVSKLYIFIPIAEGSKDIDRKHPFEIASLNGKALIQVPEGDYLLANPDDFLNTYPLKISSDMIGKSIDFASLKSN